MFLGAILIIRRCYVLEINLNKIVSADELSADTQKIKQMADEQGEMFVFDNNKPQFVILSLESYERLTGADAVAGSSAIYEVKIGKLVQDTFLKLVDKDMLPQKEIEQLCSLEYSKAVFGLNFAMLKEFDPDPNVPIDVQKRDGNGYNRYYKYLIDIHNKQYLLCSQWNESLHRKKYLNWLEKWD